MFKFLAAPLLVLLGLLILNTQCSPPLQLESLSGLDDGFDLKNEIFAGVRLPRNVQPIHYDLQIRPIVNLPESDPTRFTAPGSVTIRVRCLTPTDIITLHAKEIVIQHENVTVTHVGADRLTVRNHTEDETVSTYSIHLGSILLQGVEYDVVIPFTSLVGDRMEGLYRSSYLNVAEERVWLATTQFQKLGARLAFPCFDEPNFRSTFNITIGRHADHNSLSNSERLSSTPIPGMEDWFWDCFNKTVPMPPYLIAIIVSDFVSVDAPADQSDYDVKTWGPTGMTTETTGEFSARAAAQILTFFETYFDSPYQFPKLDSVAVPDFEAGAMENWALNTYRVILMLWFDGESTQFEQWRQAAVIAHEISHHWFGDLVTCDWWNDLWLNEGFARYMQFLGANVSLTQHGVMDRYTIDTIQLAMDYDVTAASVPVRTPVTDVVVNPPSRIIYEKAGSLIRMMQGFLTEDTLIKGLRTYLKKYEYQNTVQDQLFTELQAQAEIDGTTAPFTVKEIMDTWTLRKGFPIVRVSRAGGNVIFISQESFLPMTRQDENELWYVPIAYATKTNPDFSAANSQPKKWLDKGALGTTLTVNTTQWIIVNPDARSYFRVIYDAYFHAQILSQLNEDHELISLSSRSQIIDDYFKSAFAGYVTIEHALDFTKYLANEDENTVWTAVFNNLRQTKAYLQDSPTYAAFKDYLFSKVEGPLNRLSWEGQPTDIPVNVILRSQLLDWACALDAPNCSTVVDAYIVDLEAGERIPADYQPMAYCNAIRRASTFTSFNIREHVLNEYKSAIRRPERQTMLLNALACESEDAEIIRLLTEATTGSADILKTHSVQLIQRIAENPANRGKVLDLDIATIVSYLGEGAINSIMSTLAGYTTDSAMIIAIDDAIVQAISTVNNENIKRSLEASRARLVANGQWDATYSARIQTWIAQNM